MASFWSAVNVRRVGRAAGSVSSFTSPSWARVVTEVELVKVMSVFPVSPWRDERFLRLSHVRLTDRDPGRRFHSLYDKVHRRDVLERAWGQVRRNARAPRIGQTTIADVEQYGVNRLLDELAMELQEGRFKPMPARRVYIPKPGRQERRPLSIPAIRDRVVQAAVKIVLEPVFEADML